jgi:hypothetical protein
MRPDDQQQQQMQNKTDESSRQVDESNQTQPQERPLPPENLRFAELKEAEVED